MQTKRVGGTRGLRMLAAGATLAGLLAVAPNVEAQAPVRDSARADEAMRRGPRGPGDRQMDPAQRIERQVTMLSERLSFTERQATQIRGILTEEQAQMQAVRSQMDSVRTRSEQRISAVLNEQQRATWRQMRAERRAGFGGRGEGRPPRDRGAERSRGGSI